MSVLPRLSNEWARALFLDRHGLATAPSGIGKGSDLQRVISELGFVQLDSINTVVRAHHMILHARRTSYRPANLHHLHDRDRGVFEHWNHDASMIDMAHFPHWRLRFARNEAKLAERWTKWGRDFADKLDVVRRQIADTGPCSSSDVGLDEPRSSGGWWDWHPSKVALEYLWRTGELSVTRRDAFRKVYDLTENVIPPEYLNARPAEGETIDWACGAALDRLGFATPHQICAFWDLVTPAESADWVRRAAQRGEVVPAHVTEVDGTLRKVFIRPETLEAGPPDVTPRLRVLSPFDPALRDRKRAERLFDFSYRIEIFVPEAKRTYGYYVFPILEGDRLVGRIDMKAERDRDRLHVKAFWPEAGVKMGKGRIARLESALDRTARLADVPEVTFAPDWLRGQ